jgi:hypothetical protein
MLWGWLLPKAAMILHLTVRRSRFLGILIGHFNQNSNNLGPFYQVQTSTELMRLIHKISLNEYS